MAVNLSPVGGVAAQFFDNDGNVLSGGKIYTYIAGTSTPTPTYTTAAGNITHSNPIVLDSGGRVPTGEIWLTDGVLYKFVLKDSGDALIATYDNISGINSIAVNAAEVTYDPPFTNSVATNVEAKLAQYVSVLDFGAVGDGDTDDYQAIQNALDAVGHTGTVLFPFLHRFVVSQPIQLHGANIILQGSLGAYPTFHSATMSDGRTSAAIVYVANVGGNGKGTAISGSFNVSFFDIDAADVNGVQRADHCIEYQNADNFLAQQLLLKNALVSNVRVSGQGYANNFKDVVSAYSPIGFEYDVFDPVGGSTGNAHFDNCYATQCATGYFLHNLFSASMNACAADACDIGLDVHSNGRVSINGWNSEGSIQFIKCDSGYISCNDALITYLGVNSSISPNAYSGQTGSPVSTTGVYGIELLNGGVVELKGALFSQCDSSCEYIVKADQYSKFVELNNWANYNTQPKLSILQRAISLGSAVWAVSFAAGSYAFDMDNLTTYPTTGKTLVQVGLDVQANDHTSYSPTANPGVDFQTLPGGSASTYTGIGLQTRGTTLTETATAYLVGVSQGNGNADLAMGPMNSYTYREAFRLKRLGACRFYPLAAAPASAEEGDVYYDSTTHKLYCYDGSTWNALF